MPRNSNPPVLPVISRPSLGTAPVLDSRIGRNPSGDPSV